MNALLGIVGAAVVVVGGYYIVKKTGALDKISDKLKATGINIKESFIEGYAEVAQAKAS